MKKIIASVLLLSLWPAMVLGDSRSFQIPGDNAPILQGIQGHPLMVPLEVNIASGGAAVDQGASGVSTDPWFVNLRDAAGNELGLVGTPLHVQSATLATSALQVTSEALLATIDADTSTLAGAVSGTEFQVDVITSALPTGASTSALQTTGNTSLATLAGAVSGTEFQVDVLTSALPTGASTSALQTTGNTSLATLAGAVAGTEFQVDVITSALPTGASTSALQTTGNTSLASIVTNTTGLAGTVSGSELQVDIITSALPTGASTSALQTTGNTSLATLAGAVSGTEFQVDVLTSALPSGASTSANQTTGNTNTNAIELNTDTGTGLGEPFLVSCTGTATVIDGVDAGRREMIMQNAANSKIYIGGPAVTTSIGLIVIGGQVADDGKGGILTMDSTGAMSCITDGGTEILRVWELKD